MKELRKKTFKNGVVYCLQLEDGFLVETTDTFLPYYTKDAIGRHQNKLDNNELGDRTERWMGHHLGNGTDALGEEVVITGFYSLVDSLGCLSLYLFFMGIKSWIGYCENQEEKYDKP